MNAFNRLVMLVIALLLLAVPTLILLVGFGVIPTQLANTYTGYQSAAGAVGSFSVSDISNTASVIAGATSALVALIALILIFRELTPRRRPAKQAMLSAEAGKETKITNKGVRSLVAGATREAGGLSPSISLSSRKRAYKVDCKVTVPESDNYTETAERARGKIQEVLDNQGVPVREVEVTVEGAASGTGSQNA